MTTTAWTGTLHGIDALPIEVEVDLLRRLPGICIVGLPDNAIRESGERIRSAIQSSGFEFPRKRVVINLAPANQKKDGTSMDLPIALAILGASGQIEQSGLERFLIAGELSLSGDLRSTTGGLALAQLARKTNRIALLPESSAQNAALIPDVDVYGFKTLSEVAAFLNGTTKMPTSCDYSPSPQPKRVDFSQIRGQALAKRALEIAAAGGHHVLMLGPPGCGKTMLAKAFPALLPDPTYEEAIEITRIHNIAGKTNKDGKLIRHRPFRSPHHTVTIAGMVGDRKLRPGEICLAHNGVLFLDEATEFSRGALETLRQPLENQELQLTRAIGTACYPANFNLLMAANPCPCGNYGTNLTCRCPERTVSRYLAKLSGPILDRIDLHVRLERCNPDVFFRETKEPCSADIHTRVCKTRAFASKRITTDNNLAEANEQIELSVEAQSFLLDSATSMALSNRGITRTLRVARTIADFDQSEAITRPHIAEALAFRVRTTS